MERERVGFQGLVDELQGRVLNNQYALYSGDPWLIDLAMTDWPVIERIMREGFQAFIETETWEAWIRLETFKRLDVEILC